MNPYTALSLYCVPSQVYNTMCRAFPRRFVLPLHVTSETPTGQNMNTRPSSSATCVKISKDKVSLKLNFILKYVFLNLHSLLVDILDVLLRNMSWQLILCCTKQTTLQGINSGGRTIHLLYLSKGSNVMMSKYSFYVKRSCRQNLT